MKRRIFVMLVIVCMFIGTMSYATANVSENALTEIDLANSEVRSLTFEEMVNEIAEKTGKSTETVVDEFVANEIVELNKAAKITTSYKKADIIKKLSTKGYITVYSGVFPTFKNIYRPRGLSFYGEGTVYGQDHTAMTRILNVVFDRSNSLPGYSNVKQFSGNVYTNLEGSERIYYSVDGDFYNNGTTTTNTSVNIGIGESASISIGVSNATAYFDYINHNGRWYG